MYTPLETTSGLAFLVDLLRFRISDQKRTFSNVVSEDAGTSVGTGDEYFYTDNMPIASGFDTFLRGGRWFYTQYDTVIQTENQRGYIFSIESGSFYIPSVATHPTSGDRVKVGYTWLEEQTYKFSDNELKYYIGDAISQVNAYYDFGSSFGVSAGSPYITPALGPSDLGSYMYVQYAAYLIRKQLESEGFGDRIYVKDINITIDTSKGLSDLSKSSKELLDNFHYMIGEIRLRGQTSVLQRIDTYSTWRPEGEIYNYDTGRYVEDKGLF